MGDEGGRAAVVQATAAVFAGGRRAGSAVLVDDRHLITAAHVLLRFDPDTGAKAPVVEVEVEFPAVPAGGKTCRAAASRLDLGPSGAVDVAVLDLGEERPTGLPAPLPVWPAARMPDRVAVFGYPLAEGPLNGVWREFKVAGPTTAGAVQLDWTGDTGTFPGHSGGPVVSPAGNRLAGILVEGSEAGRFDRFLPVTLIARVWPPLPRRWLMTGAGQAGACDHFHHRAHGHRGSAGDEDLFRGRDAALAAVRRWLTAAQPPGRPLVITGQPGAGKSAVIARAALQLEGDRVGPGLAFHGRGASHADLLHAVANVTGVDRYGSADSLIGALRDHGGRPCLVVVDALDEVGTTADRRQIVDLLMNLAALPGLRVAVATRPLAAGLHDRYRYSPDALLPTLGVTSADSASLVDLDTGQYFDPAGVRDYAAALLTQLGADPGNPPGGGWSRYRADSQMRNRVAAMVADRAGRNYLVAALAAERLSRDAVVDPAAPGFDPRVIPASVGEALAKYLDGLALRQRVHVRALLVALGYARGAGIDDRTWLAFATALGYEVSVEDLDELRDSAAVDYLLQTARTADRRPVTRLFHQALTDELLYPRDQPDDERLLVDFLLDEAARTGWASSYLRQHAADHAAAADRLDQLLEDPQYLLAAEPTRLVPHLGRPRSTTARTAAIVYRQAAHDLTDLDPASRASQLELYARRLGYPTMAGCIADAAPKRPWHTHWSHGRAFADHQTLTGHTDSVNAVAVGALPDGSPVVVSGSDDETVRVWRLADGSPVGHPFTGHTSSVTAVAVGALPDGTPVVVSGGSYDDETVRVWQLADGSPVGHPFTGHTGSVNAVAVGALPDGTPVVVSGGDHTVRVWQLSDGRPTVPPVAGAGNSVYAVAVGALPDGTPVMVSAGDDAAVHVWRLADGSPVGHPLGGHSLVVPTVAVGALPDGTAVVVSGSDDKTVRVWRLADGSPVGHPFTGHTGSVAAVAVGALPDGSPVVVSGSDDETVRVWQLADGAPVGHPFTGHTGGVTAVALAALPDGTAVVVSGSDDGTVRVWQLADGAPVGHPLTGHTGSVTAVAVGALPDGTPVVVSGSRYNETTVRVWRLADGSPVGRPFTGHNYDVLAVAVGALPDGTPVVVSGSQDSTVRVWRLADGASVGHPLRHVGLYDLAVGALPDGTPVVVSFDIIGHGSDELTARLWRLADGRPVGHPLTFAHNWVRAVAVGALPDGTPVVVSGSRYNETTVRVWRLTDGAPVGHPFTGHTGSVAVAMTALPDGTPVVVSGGDRTVSVWRLADGSSIGPPLWLPAPVGDIAVHDNLVITAAHTDIAVHAIHQPESTSAPATRR